MPQVAQQVGCGRLPGTVGYSSNPQFNQYRQSLSNAISYNKGTAGNIFATQNDAYNTGKKEKIPEIQVHTLGIVEQLDLNLPFLKPHQP